MRCVFNRITFNMDSEEEAIKLLEKVDDAASDAELAVASYLFRALLPDKTHLNKVAEWYVCLRQSSHYYHTALSLVCFVIQDVAMNKDKNNQLQAYVKANTVYESDVLLPKFLFRTMLSSMLSRLDDDDIDDLIREIGSHHLEKHQDRFTVDTGSRYEAGLRLLECAENNSVLPHSDFELLQKFLLRRSRNDLIQNHLDDYNSNRPIRLAVMNVEILPGPPSSVSPGPQSSSVEKSAWTTYRNLLIESYKVMPIIPFGQWPPVRKAHYVSLALITNEAMPRHDVFSRGTIRGSVDDIYKKKIPAEFKQVFSKNLARDKRLLALIEGRPGCGKSTLVTKVSKDWAEEEILQDVELFVLVRLRRFLGRENITLEEIFGVYCANVQIVSALVEQVTESGGKGVCFALDGLDEYSAVFKGGNLINDLILGYKLPNASIFMASRPAGSHRLRTSTILDQHIEIVGFLEEEIELYINDYYHEDPVKAKKLLKYLEDHPNIARMCYLPLHIAMVVFLYDLGEEYLPNTETDLYNKFVLHTLRRSLEREISDPDEQDDLELHDFKHLPMGKRPIFLGTCQLAFEATIKQKQIFTGEEILESELSMVDPKKKAFDSLGLLTVDRMAAKSSLPTKTFSFLHLTLQEFLSAVYLVYHLKDEHKQQINIIKEHGGKVHMWVVWKFYSGLSTQRGNEIFSSAFHDIASQNVSDGLPCLSMMHCAFEAKKEDVCVDLLSKFKGRVNVQDVALNPSDCAAIGYVVMSAHKELQDLDLSYCHLGPSGIDALVQQFEMSERKLVNANILRMRARTDFKPVGSEGAPSLVKLLKKLPNLGELRLYGNQLKTERFKHLVPVIQSMGKLHTLIVSRNALDVTTGEYVSKILCNLPVLHTFYISYNKLGDKGLGAMKPGLLKCLELKILGLRGTGLTEGAGVHLKCVLETLPKLEWIELYQNQLRDQGVIDLVPGLFKAKSLKMMSLVENEITDRGAKALSKYLSATTTLQQLRIYYNHGMTDEGKIALRSAEINRPTSMPELRCAV